MNRAWWGLPFVAVLLVLGCSENAEDEAPSAEVNAVPFVWPKVAPQPEMLVVEPTPESEENQAPEPFPETTGPGKAPRIVVRKGKGPAFVSLKLQADSTLVVAGEHRGVGNFTVELIPAKKTRVSDRFVGSVFRSSGRFKGQAAVTDLTPGRYRASVDAHKSWKLKFAQPVPNPEAKSIPTRLEGNGAKVRQIRVESELSALVTARHKGTGTFIVKLIPMQDVASPGEDSQSLGVFRWRGSLPGERRLESLRPGTYLVSVLADGRWTLNFAIAES